VWGYQTLSVAAQFQQAQQHSTPAKHSLYALREIREGAQRAVLPRSRAQKRASTVAMLRLSRAYAHITTSPVQSSANADAVAAEYAAAFSL
jgi:hypothetical protein